HFSFVYVNPTSTSEIYTLSLHDALPIFHDALSRRRVCPERNISIFPDGLPARREPDSPDMAEFAEERFERGRSVFRRIRRVAQEDRKSTRLNSSHVKISYAVFCLKKKTK